MNVSMMELPMVEASLGDHKRHYIRAFSSSYGPYMILEIELRAILVGILLARGFGISTIWVEADSTTAIH